jgi:hypothetical protein
MGSKMHISNDIFHDESDIQKKIICDLDDLKLMDEDSNEIEVQTISDYSEKDLQTRRSE